MSENDFKEMLVEKSKELKDWIEDMSVNLDKWKFSMEDTEEGTRIEIEINALIKNKK
jgi:hypothetical protein